MAPSNHSLKNSNHNRQHVSLTPQSRKRSSSSMCVPHWTLGMIGLGCCVAYAVTTSLQQVDQRTSYMRDLLDVPQRQGSDLMTTVAAAITDAIATDSHRDTAAAVNSNDPDANCIFRHSPLYRKIYVYPSPNEPEWSTSPLVNDYGRNSTAMKWPWLELDRTARANARAHYNIHSSNVQYATELLVRELMVNPASCLRTSDPDQATLFYVPYLPSMEHHVGHDRKTDYAKSPYGMAILDILDTHSYTAWERNFGLTSQYWQRRQGADHILVFSEPMHGLWHPRSKRGNYHFVHTQKQLTPPIVVSVELSTAFVTMYPQCARTNILVPYPNTHGDWFNGVYEREARELVDTNGQGSTGSTTTAVAKLATDPDPNRVVTQYYAAGNHGTCTQLRKAMKQDYNSCAPSWRALQTIGQSQTDVTKNNAVAMRLSTFCPCPGGDSPSAKRMFDALVAGCIPVILSKDFVWPFTREFDPASLNLDPADFSIRLNATDYDTPLLDPKTCTPVDANRPGLQAYLEQVPASEIARLKRGVTQAAKLFAWYDVSEGLPQNPLRDGVLPNGGTAHFVVEALAQRAEGVLYPACEAELQTVPKGQDPNKFQC